MSELDQMIGADHLLLTYSIALQSIVCFNQDGAELYEAMTLHLV